MFKKIVFMVTVMAFALAASAAEVRVHIDEDSATCSDITVYLMDQGYSYQQYHRHGRFEAGHTEIFTINYGIFHNADAVKVVGENYWDEDIYLIVNPNPAINDAYIWLWDGTSPPPSGTEPNDPD
jgi:hypothetical protein